MKIQKMLMAVSIPVLLSITSASYAGSCTGPCDVSTVGTSAVGGTGSELRLNDVTAGFPINDTINGQDWSIKNVFESATNSRLTIGRVGLTDPFVIEDDAGNNVLVVDDNNRVGINTTTPGEELEINSFHPALRLNDRSTGAVGGFVDLFVDVNRFVIENKTGVDAFVMETAGGTAQANQIYLDSNGDVGIQVANPVADLHVGGTGNILLENGTNDWAIYTNFNGLFFRKGNNTVFGSVPLVIETNAPNNSLRIRDDGKIGMGTQIPAASLHVRKTDGTATLLVEEASSTTAVRQILNLKNNGPVGFQMRDTTDTHPWDFRTGGGGSFLIANLGTAGPEVFVSKTGLVKMGPNVQNFTLAAAGNLTIPNGSVTATNFVTSSSRTVKTDFTKVDPTMVMDKLKQLDVSGWRYKDEDVKGRHIGPIAEDFYKLFELGPDNKHISATDMASIAIVASKKLQEETATLKTENEALQKRLASLEKLVTNLASSNGHLNNSGAKVALK